MYRIVSSIKGRDSAYRMMEAHNQALRATDNDDYRYLSDKMNAEIEQLKQQGKHWSEYVPSNELRNEARSLGYSIRKQRAKGAMPYAIEPGNKVNSATTIRTYQNKRNPNKHMEVHEDGYGHRSALQYMEWKETGVKNPTGDGNLHRYTKQDLDGILEDYEEVPVQSSQDIRNSREYENELMNKVCEQIDWDLKRGKIVIDDIDIDLVEETAECALTEEEFLDFVTMRLDIQVYQSY